MSNIIDMEVDLSYREKTTAVILIGYLAVYGWYFARVADAARSGPIAEIDYQGLLIVMVGVLVAATVVAQVLIAVLKPAEAEQVDERDRMIALRGDRVAGWVVTIGALAGLGLAMIEADSFWIAHALVAGLVLAEIFKAIAMLVNYRRSL
jgi:hypothetical protein